MVVRKSARAARALRMSGTIVGRRWYYRLGVTCGNPFLVLPHSEALKPPWVSRRPRRLESGGRGRHPPTGLW
jgi:hypothetical protein